MNLVVTDETDLINILQRNAQKGNKIYHFRIAKNSLLIGISVDDMAQRIANMLSDILHKDSSIQYMIDMDTGKCVIEVV